MSDYEAYQLFNSVSNNSSYTSAATGASIWGIIALVLAIVGGILVYFLFVKAKTEPKGKFAKWLKDFLSFKIMWIEPILKVVYYVATIFTVLYSFTFLALGGYGFLMFLMCLVLGPIIIRIVYEATMMFIMIWRNTRDIAENTKKK
ncbi:MAG: hypothetical protein Q4C24_03380 [Candidatus Saccharibacteria bacterium]|nr:hypothetical protein [Candidatus Saccharibacteria bacterium]